MNKGIISVGLALMLGATVVPARALFESDRTLSEKVTDNIVDRSTAPLPTRDPIKHVTALFLVFLLTGVNGCRRPPAIQSSADNMLQGSLSDQRSEQWWFFPLKVSSEGFEQETLVKYFRLTPPRRPGGLTRSASP